MNPLTRDLHRLLAGLVLGAGLGMSLACGGASEAPAPTAAAAPELPADVAEVASDLAKAQASSGAPAAGETVPASAAATPSGFPEVIESTGEFTSPVRSELVIRTPGRVARILVEEGDRVRRGQTLLELETQYLVPEVERAEAEVQRTRAAQAEAKSDFERKEQLLARSAIPQASYDRSKGAYEQAEAAAQAAEAALALARQKLSDAALTSPINGFVAERRADVGERLGDNTVAFVLMQLSPLRARFFIPERFIALVRPGQQVEAESDAYPGEVFRGNVTQVGNMVDSGSRSFPVEAELANGDGRLRPGLFARVRLYLGSPAAGGGR